MSLEGPIWDGNGGTLDPQKAPQRDLLIALHVKMDQVIIPQLKDLTEALSQQRLGEFTRAQKLSIRDVMQDDADKRLGRRSLKAPIIALVISLVALVTSIVLTLAVGGVFG